MTTLNETPSALIGTQLTDAEAYFVLDIISSFEPIGWNTIQEAKLSALQEKLGLI
jgi:hypothetical protein